MSISGIQLGQGILNANHPSKDRGRQVQRELTSSQQANNAGLSESSKLALSSTQRAVSRLCGNSNEQYPIEYYAMPNWMAVLSPVELTGQLGAKSNELYAKGGQLIGTYDRERSEYEKLLDGHYQSLMAKEGIDTPQKHYEALIANKYSSERLHQLMMKSINGDSRMKELMAILKIDMM